MLMLISLLEVENRGAAMHTLEAAVPVIAAVAFRRHKYDFTRVTCTPYLVVAIGIGHCQACSVPVQHNGRGFNLHGLETMQLTP